MLTDTHPVNSSLEVGALWCGDRQQIKTEIQGRILCLNALEKDLLWVQRSCAQNLTIRCYSLKGLSSSEIDKKENACPFKVHLRIKKSLEACEGETWIVMESCLAHTCAHRCQEDEKLMKVRARLPTMTKVFAAGRETLKNYVIAI